MKWPKADFGGLASRRTMMNKHQPAKKSSGAGRKSKDRASRRSSRDAPEPPVPDRRFTELMEAYPNNPALRAETIYSIPGGLIDAVKEAIPDFFSPAEEAFERDLARLSGSGFFMKRPIRHPFLPGPDLLASEVARFKRLEQRHQQTAIRIREMLREELRQRGRSDAEIEAYFKDQAAYERRVEERQLGFLGWLVTDPGFRKCRKRFRSAWKDKIRKSGAFPEVPRSLMGETPDGTAELDRPFKADYMQFFQHWSLQSMATWELPIPMRPEIMGRSLYYLPSISEAGVVLFVPWYLLRDKNIGLREATLHQQSLLGPPQLNEWMSGKPKKWGHERFALMFRLYVYLELSLKQRYGLRPKWRTGTVGRALARFLKPDRNPDIAEATVGKVRKEMNRRLDERSRGTV